MAHHTKLDLMAISARLCPGLKRRTVLLHPILAVREDAGVAFLAAFLVVAFPAQLLADKRLQPMPSIRPVRWMRNSNSMTSSTRTRCVTYLAIDRIRDMYRRVMRPGYARCNPASLRVTHRTLRRRLLLVMTINAAAHPELIKFSLINVKHPLCKMAIGTAIARLKRLLMLDSDSAYLLNRAQNTFMAPQTRLVRNLRRGNITDHL